MNTVLCFTERYCPFKGEVRGFDGGSVKARPRPYYNCLAKSLEHMQACVLREDEDLNKYNVKVLVRKRDKSIKAWDPKKTLVQRLDRDEQIDGQIFDRLEV